MLESQKIPDTTFERLISAYTDARTAWLSTAAPDGELTASGIHFERFERACLAVILYSCPSHETVSRKIFMVLEDADLYAMVREDEVHNDDVLRLFLASLIASSPESKSQ
jgi:hypothetical protein